MKTIKTKLAGFFLLVLASAGLFLTCDVGLGDSVSTKPPTVSIEYPPVDSIVKNTFTMSGKSNAETSLKQVAVQLTDTTTASKVFGPYAATVDATKKTWSLFVNKKNSSGVFEIPDGSYQAVVTAIDDAGRTNTAAITYRIDNTPPVLVLQTPSTVASDSTTTAFGKKLNITGMVSDANSVKSLTLNVFDQHTLVCLLSHTFESIPPNIDVSLPDAQYTSLYESASTSASSDGTKNYYYTVSATDYAAEYTPQTSTGAGNATDGYYIYSKIYSSVFGGTPSYTMTDLQNICNGLKADTGNILTYLASNKISSADPTAATASAAGTFSINPLNNPTFAVQTFDSLNLASLNYPDIAKNSTISIQVSVGRDNVPLVEDSIGVKMYYMTDYTSPLEIDADGNAVLKAGAVFQTLLHGVGTVSPAEDSAARAIDLAAKQNNGTDRAMSVSSSGSNYLLAVYLPDSLPILTNYYLEVTGHDKNGNEVSIGKKKYGFHITGTGVRPTITVNTAPGTFLLDGNVHYVGTVQFSNGYKAFTVTGSPAIAGTLTVKKDGSAVTIGAMGLVDWDYTAAISSAGNNEFTFKAVDLDDGETTEKNHFYYDKDPPVITVNSVSPSTLVSADYDAVSLKVKDINGTVTVSGNFSDDYRVSSGSWKAKNNEGDVTESALIAPANLASWTFSVNTSLLDDKKDNTIEISTTDASGRTTTRVITLQVDQSTDIPVVTFTNYDPSTKLPGGLYPYVAETTLKGMVSDDDGVITGMTAKVNGTDVTVSRAGGNFSIPLSAEGVKTVIIGVTDKSTKTFTFDASSSSLKVTNGTEIIQPDSAMNIVVDTATPILSIDQTQNAYHKDAFLLSGTASDSGTGILDGKISVYGDATVTVDSDGKWSKTIDASALQDDEYTIPVAAYDKTGQITNATFKFIKDSVGPDVKVDSTIASTIQTGWQRNANIFINGNVNDDLGTKHSGVKSVEYSTNGTSGPWTAFTLTDDASKWSGVVSFADGNNHLYIRATDNAGNVTTNIPLLVNVDTVKPTLNETAVYHVDSPKSYNGDITFMGTVTDGSPSSGIASDLTLSYKLNGFSQDPILIPLAKFTATGGYKFNILSDHSTDGSYEFTLTAKDNAGNTDSVSYSVTVETKPPVITYNITPSTTLAGTDYYNGTVDLKASITDDNTLANVYWQVTANAPAGAVAPSGTTISGGGWTQFSSANKNAWEELSYNTTTLTSASGNQYVNIVAIDRFGNYQQSSFSMNVDQSTDKPVIAYSNLTSGAAYLSNNLGKTLVLNGTVSDDDGVNKDKILIGVAKDEKDNDTLLPGHDGKPDTPFDYVAVNGKPSANGKQVSFSENLGSTGLNLPEGYYVLQVQAGDVNSGSDMSNNWRQGNVERFVIDKASPVVTINQAQNQYFGSSFTLSGTAIDSGTHVSSSDSGTYPNGTIIIGGTTVGVNSDGTWSTTVSSGAEGANSISIACSDLAGQETEASFSFMKDTSKPKFVTVTGLSGWQNSQNVTISGTASDTGTNPSGVAKVEYQVNSGSWQLLSGTETWSGVAVIPRGDSNTLILRVTDAAGNEAFNPINPVKVDDIVPTVSVHVPSSLIRVNGVNPVPVQISAADIPLTTEAVSGISTVKLKVNSTDFAISDAAVTKNDETGYYEANIPAGKFSGLSNGSQYSVNVQVADAAGNTAMTSFPVLVDNDPPTVTIATPTAGTTVNKTISITGTGSDNQALKTVVLEIQKADSSWASIKTFSGTDGFNWSTSFDTEYYGVASYDTGIADGIQLTIRATATDEAGNTPAVVTRTFTVDQDSDRPVIKLTNLSVPSLISLSIDPSTDVCTASAAHGLKVGDAVGFMATTTPGGISARSTYYVMASGLTETSFKVAATRGGVSVNFTSSGSGVTLAYGGAYPATLKQTRTIYGSVSDDDGALQKIEVSEDGVVWTEIELDGGSWMFDALDPDGAKKLYFRVTDSQNAAPFVTGGATSPRIQIGSGYYMSYVDYKLDTVTPEFASSGAVLVDETGTSFASAVDVISNMSLGGNDKACALRVLVKDANGIDTVKVSIPGLSVVSAVMSGTSGDYSVFDTPSIDLTSVANGSVTISIEATDNSGLKSTATRTVKIDTVPPSVSFINPSSGTVLNGSVQVRGVTSDATSDVVKVEYSIGNDYATDGWHEFPSTSRYNWMLDFTGNTLNESDPSALGNMNLYATADEATILDGIYTIPIMIRATDSAGNVYTTTTSTYVLNVNPDSDRPTATVSYPYDPAKSLGGSIRVSGSAVDDDGVSEVYMMVDVDGDDNYTSSDKVTADFDSNGVTPDTTIDWFNGGNGQKVTGTANWYQVINSVGEFNPSSGTTRTIHFKVRVKDINGLYGPWTTSQQIIIDINVPSFNSFTYKKTGSADKPYSPNLYLSGNWTLSGEISDEGDISSITVLDGSTTLYTQSASSVFTAATFSGGRKGYIMNLPINTPAGEAGQKTLTIKASDNGTTPNESTIEIKYYYDNKAPSAAFGMLISSGTATTRPSTTSMTASLTTAAYNSIAVGQTISLNGISKIITGKSGGNTITWSGDIDVSFRSFGITSPELPVINSNGAYRVQGIALDNGSDIDKVYAYFRRAGATPRYFRASDGAVLPETAADVFTPSDGSAVNYPSDSSYLVMIDAKNEDGGQGIPDGDSYSEKLKQVFGDSYVWYADINSAKIADGPIEIHYVVFDTAGNTTHYVLNSFIQNHSPAVSSVTLGTDLNGNAVIDADEQVQYTDGNASLAGFQATTSFQVKESPMSFDLGLVGGNGQIDYAIYDVSIAPVPVTTTTANKYYVVASLGSGSFPANYVVGSVYKATGAGSGSGTVYPVYQYGIARTAGGSLNQILIDSTVLSQFSQGTKNFTIGLWDTTDETTCGIDSLSVKSVISAVVATADSVAPKAVIDPFYWNSAIDNSIYQNSKANGHIDINLNKLGDSDPKVSGKVSVRGSVYDDQRITAIWMHIDNFTFGATPALPTKLVGGKTFYKVASYSAGVWSDIASDAFDETNGWDFDIVTNSISQSGHAVTWRLDWNSAKVTDVAGKDANIMILADDKGGARTASARGSTTTLVDASLHGRTDLSGLTIMVGSTTTFVTAFDNVTNTLSFNDAVATGVMSYRLYNTVNSTVVSTGDQTTKNVPLYQIDVVPYISGITTSLSAFYTSAPSVFDRSSQGKYPVRSGEIVRVKGFNFNGSSTGISVNGTASSNVAAVSGQTTTAVDVTLQSSLSSGGMVATVNSVTSLNNENVNTNDYNKQPNAVNNNLLSDDAMLDVWQFTTAATPKGGPAAFPTMKVNVGGDKIGFSYGNAVVYFSMPGYDNPNGNNTGGSFWSQTAFDKNYGWFTSNTFAFDPKGGTYGVALCPDTDSNPGTSANFMFYSRRANKKISDFALDENYNGSSNRYGVTGAQANTAVAALSTKRRIENTTASLSDATGDTGFVTDIYRIQSPDMVTSMKNPLGTITDVGGGNPVNVYLAYYDNLSKQIRYRWATVGANSYDIGNAFTDIGAWPNNVTNWGTRVATPQDVPTSNMQVVASEASGSLARYSTTTAAQPGKYVAIGVVPNATTNSGNDVVCLAWYDSNARKLMFSYNTDPQNLVGSTTQWQDNRCVIDDAGGWYVKMAVDSDGGIHLAYYTASGGDLKYAYLSSYSDTSPDVVTVDSYLSVGTYCTIDVGKDGSGHQVPYISYFMGANSGTSGSTRVAYRTDFTSATFEGVDSSSFYTGKWEIETIPTSKTPSESQVSVGLSKDSSGLIQVFPTGTDSTHAETNTYAVSDSTRVYGNGTTNPVVGYACDENIIEMAQKK
jgi:hypothetical protein